MYDRQSTHAVVCAGQCDCGVRGPLVRVWRTSKEAAAANQLHDGGSRLLLQPCQRRLGGVGARVQCLRGPRWTHLCRWRSYRTICQEFSAGLCGGIRCADEPVAAETLVDCIYGFEIAVDADNALFLLKAADMLEMGQIVEACKSFLRANIDLTNWLTIWRGARQLSCRDLAEECLAFALEHFHCITPSEEFLDMDAAEIQQLIGSDELNVEKEEQVAAAVVRWLDRSPVTRLPHAADASRHIRAGLLTADYMASLPDTSTGQHLHQAIQSVLARDSASTLRNSYEPIMVSLWDHGTDKHRTAGIAYLDPRTFRSWSVPCAPPPSRWRPDAIYAVKNGRLLVYVVTKKDDTTQQLHVYDAGADQWTYLTVFPVQHPAMPLAVLHEQVFVMVDGRMCAYDEGLQQMIVRAPMPLSVFLPSSAIVSCESRIYVFGGYCRNRQLLGNSMTADTAYCYDPARDVWEELAPMPTARARCSACVGPDGLI
ncbi:kelch-like protein 3 [Paramacrobiotus metropolitanus]|uniref:kelch-like protein 3 n=1 Tax=Paramacrobiotus metropolitanus TaxID=2943436 RepID=UPI0024462A2F|nr:kelch-like protein 3 [Paramacrobiotus metropolitanus]